MLSAMFIPKHGDELTLEQALQEALRLGLVLCHPTEFSPEREFSSVCFPPDRIPAGYRPVVVKIKSPTHAVLGVPCVA